MENECDLIENIVIDILFPAIAITNDIENFDRLEPRSPSRDFF